MSNMTKLRKNIGFSVNIYPDMVLLMDLWTALEMQTCKRPSNYHSNTVWVQSRDKAFIQFRRVPSQFMVAAILDFRLAHKLHTFGRITRGIFSL
jgi:hypothetical protein